MLIEFKISEKRWHSPRIGLFRTEACQNSRRWHGCYVTATELLLALCYVDKPCAEGTIYNIINPYS